MLQTYAISGPERSNVRSVVVIGGGPAGLMAAERLAAHGYSVDVYERMPSVGRKILMAGKTGLNLTHAEDAEVFLSRYAPASATLTGSVRSFDAHAVRAWAAELGVETFVGSSGRVFPTEMKAAPLVRSWVRRLRATGVCFHVRHRWTGWDTEGNLLFQGPEGEPIVVASPVATILALGGGSWAALGSDGAWCPILHDAGATVTPLRPANCGFDVAWSDVVREKYAGQPVKTVVASFGGISKPGEFVVSAHGVEGSLVYAFSAALRDACAEQGHAVLTLDLLPGRSFDRLTADLRRPQGGMSTATYLKKVLGLEGVKAALLREVLGKSVLEHPHRLAQTIKAFPLTVLRPRPMDEAISTAGGVSFECLDAGLMLTARPGVFCCGEMLDWEAPTGGYLLTACFATGAWAAEAAARFIAKGQAV